LDFYWSPLKIFEYMATGLPVVAPDIPRLRRIVEHEHEGLLYDARDPDGLAWAIERLAEPPASHGGPHEDGARGGGCNGSYRALLGGAARVRAIRDYGWDVHCRKLDEALRGLRRAEPVRS
jgi:glycosyltransferase involved in cell wall biosynthesis